MRMVELALAAPGRLQRGQLKKKKNLSNLSRFPLRQTSGRCGTPWYSPDTAPEDRRAEGVFSTAVRDACTENHQDGNARKAFARHGVRVLLR